MVLSLFGGVGETRTLAPVTRPTPLAGVPRHQLEYYSIIVTCYTFYHNNLSNSKGSSASALLRCPTTRYCRISLVDRCAFSRSLFLPPAAFALKARHQLEYYSKLLRDNNIKMAERKGFEPLWACTQTVFKTASL